MSLLSYIVNWDEFVAELVNGITIDNVNVDTSGVENILNQYFPEIIDLLEDIKDELYLIRTKYENYNQRIKGFHNKANDTEKEFIIEWTNEKDCYLTGITFNHSHVEGVDDFFNLSIVKDDVELIFQQVYLKDSLQHKHFEKFFPVPANTVVRITHFNPSLQAKHIWYDLEYLEHKGEIT